MIKEEETFTDLRFVKNQQRTRIWWSEMYIPSGPSLNPSLRTEGLVVAKTRRQSTVPPPVPPFRPYLQQSPPV